MVFNDDRMDSRFAWFSAIAGTTTPIYANVSLMANKDKEQRQVSEDASRKMIKLNICQCLGLMNYDFFDTRDNFNKLPEEERKRILQRGKMYIDEDFEKKSLEFLYYLMSKLQQEAGISPTYEQKAHSIFQEFRVWKTNKGLIEK